MSKQETSGAVGRTLQDFANDVLAPEFVQPLMTVRQACWANGWAFAERPECCGVECEHKGFIGGSYHVECKTCGKFVADVTGPDFSGTGSVRLIDHDKFPPDTDWERCWIAGKRPSNESAH